MDPFQSAYRTFCCTETALLKVADDIYEAIENGKATILVTLDISAAFDTIDWIMLTSRLQNYFGIKGTALEWVRSYLVDRKQFVRTNNCSSQMVSLQAGVPQGSVLGPILFSAFLAPLSSVISSCNVRHHQYADDTQIYHCFAPSTDLGYCQSLSNCLDAINAWYLTNGLMVNPGKSDAILIGTSAQRNKVGDDGVSMAGTLIKLSDTVKSLGVTLDQNMNMDKHVISVCKSCTYHIRALRSIRSSLDEATAETIGRSIVMARLDYCNGLLAGVTKKNISKLQRIQNSLARVVRKTDFREHMKPVLQSLHWLPIDKRILFKVSMLVFKARAGLCPDYLSSLIVDYVPVRELRSSSKHLLAVPDTRTELARHSFSYIAPNTWNGLPDEIKTSISLNIFKSRLKTHLFKLTILST